MRISISIVVFLALTSCKKQNAITNTDTFVKYFGNAFIDEAKSMIITSNNDILFAGHTEDNLNDQNGLLIKTSENGNEEWSKTYGNQYFREELSNVNESSSGGYILTGSVEDTTGITKLMIIKTDDQGNTEFKVEFANGTATRGVKGINTSEGGYLFLANTNKPDLTNGNTTNFQDILLVKTDVNGNLEWMSNFGGFDDDLGYDIEEKSNGGFILVGSTDSFDEPGLDKENIFIVETNAVGVETNRLVYGGLDDDIAREIEILDDGYAIIGTTKSNPSSIQNVYFLKLGLNIQTTLLEKSFGGDFSDAGICIQKASNNQDLIVGGYSFSNSNGESDAYLLKIDANGNQLFEQNFGGVGSEGFNDIVELNNGRLIMLGYSLFAGNQTISLTKTSSQGELNN